MHSEFRKLPGVAVSFFYNYRTYRRNEPVNNDRLGWPRRQPQCSGNDPANPGISAGDTAHLLRSVVDGAQVDSEQQGNS
jgi:hypothetical protein